MMMTKHRNRSVAGAARAVERWTLVHRNARVAGERKIAHAFRRGISRMETLARVAGDSGVRPGACRTLRALTFGIRQSHA